MCGGLCKFAAGRVQMAKTQRGRSAGAGLPLRFLPDLPSATILNYSHGRAMSCGYSPISHRLQSALSFFEEHSVAVTPRSPIGYNASHWFPLSVTVAVTPRSPIGYNLVLRHQLR